MGIEGIDQKITARVGREAKAQRGEWIKLGVDLGSALLFDPVTTQAIENRG